MPFTPQEIANLIGTQIRSIEARAAELADTQLTNRVSRLHTTLGQAFLIAEPEHALDFDQAAGNVAGPSVVLNQQVQAGGAPKTPPRSA